MDVHPTPFPGKLRAAANAKKEKGEGRGSREPIRLTTVASRHRQNRVFGTARSTNIPAERPPPEPSKVPKQLKPSGTSKTLPLKDASRIERTKLSRGASRDDTKDGMNKPRSETKRLNSVRFQDQQVHPGKGFGVKDGMNKPRSEEAPHTPVSSIKPTVLSTPYYSAKSCSKCRFDRLESAPYWLAQIKLAESVGKHFVSAAFFRLAIDCNAEPTRSLKSELKRYMARHGSLPILTVWKDICRDYGLLEGEPIFGVIGFDAMAASLDEAQDPRPNMQQEASRGDEDGCLGCELDVIPQSDLSKEESTKDADSSSSDPKNSTSQSPSAGVTNGGDSEGSTNLMKDKSNDSNVDLDCGIDECPIASCTTPGKRLLIGKSDRGSAHSIHDSSSVSKKVRPGSLIDRSKVHANKFGQPSEFCGEATGKSEDEAKEDGNRNGQLKSMNNVENSFKTSNEAHDLIASGRSCDDSQVHNTVAC